MNKAKSNQIFPETNNNKFKAKLPTIVIAVFVISVTVYAGTAQAGGPVVCLAGAGHLDVVDFDLSTCHAPVDRPVYIELHLRSTSTTPVQGYLAAGTLSCNVSAPVSQTADCAVSVFAGRVDQIRVDNAEHYRLAASWSPYDSVYTKTLSSGAVTVLERSYTYGERSIGWLLVFISALMILLVIMLAVLIRRF